MSFTRKFAVAAGALAAVALIAGAVRADEHEEEEDEAHEHEHERRHHGRERREGEREGWTRSGVRRTPFSAIDPAYAKECGACHLAFPPRLLPAASWTRLMAGLGSHFGQDAELDEGTRASIERWLVERAGRPREEGAPLRVTERSWFRREHRKVLGAASRPAVRSMANCGACHGGAERWDFDEDGVKIPRG